MASSRLPSPLLRATFPSYDLCFPALPVKKEGGPPFRLAVLRWGWRGKSGRYLARNCSGFSH